MAIWVMAQTKEASLPLPLPSCFTLTRVVTPFASPV